MPRIAVAIPCYNEAAAIAVVLAQWREALPEAELWVFDNNSSDGTGDRARQEGAQVVAVPEQGKGYAVRAIFATLAGCDAVIMVDGDGTYPASAGRALLAPVLGDSRGDDRRGASAGSRGRGDVTRPQHRQLSHSSRVPRPDRTRSGRPAIGLPGLQPALP